MKFTVEHIGKAGGRIGKLSGLRSQPDVTLETPLFLVTTLAGSAPHLTQVRSLNLEGWYNILDFS